MPACQPASGEKHKSLRQNSNGQLLDDVDDADLSADERVLKNPLLLLLRLLLLLLSWWGLRLWLLLFLFFRFTFRPIIKMIQRC